MNLIRKEIVNKILEGDKTSFEYVYRYYYPRLVHFTNQYLNDKETSNNIVQDVFTELWDNKEKLLPDTNLTAWLFTVAKNKSLKVIARITTQQRYYHHIQSRQLSANYKALTDFDTSDSLFEELEYLINAALKKLPPTCKKVFEMSRFEDRKNREIAEELKLSIKTVEAHLTKALKALKAELRDYLPLVFILFYFHK